MSLLRLLTTGKSLVGLSDTESRYRVTSQRLLPQFGPARNPFSSRAKAEPAQTEARPPGEHSPSGAPEETHDTPGLSRKGGAALQSRPEGRTPPASSNAHSLSGMLRLRTTALLSRWRAKLSGLFDPAGGKAAKPAIPRFPKLPVQGELSLDRIKVVRNDLSDADLEVVPAKAPAPRAVENAKGARSAWGRVTTRILGAGKT